MFDVICHSDMDYELAFFLSKALFKYAKENEKSYFYEICLHE